MNVGNVSDAVRNGLVRNGDGNRTLHLECEPWLCFSLESGLEKALWLPVLATSRAHRACVYFGCRMGPSVLCSVTPAFLFLSTRGWASWGRDFVFLIFDFSCPQGRDLSKVRTEFSPISIPPSRTLSYIFFLPSRLPSWEGWAQRPLTPAPKLALLVTMFDVEVLKHAQPSSSLGGLV